MRPERETFSGLKVWQWPTPCRLYTLSSHLLLYRGLARLYRGSSDLTLPVQLGEQYLHSVYSNSVYRVYSCTVPQLPHDVGPVAEGPGVAPGNACVHGLGADSSTTNIQDKI